MNKFHRIIVRRPRRRRRCPYAGLPT